MGFDNRVPKRKTRNNKKKHYSEKKTLPRKKKYFRRIFKKYKIINIQKKNIHDLRQIVSENDKNKVKCNCIICLEDIDKGFVYICNSCNNCFHYKCIKKWVIESNTIFCPLCRKPSLGNLRTSSNSSNNNSTSTSSNNSTSTSSNNSTSTSTSTSSNNSNNNSNNVSNIGIVTTEVILISIFSLPVWGITGGIIDPITSSNIIHVLISLALTSGIITPTLHL